VATLYVRSTDGNNADNGTTWALAKLDLAGAAAIDSAGDTIYVSQNHAESTASAVTLSFAGTIASPVKIICGNDAAEPPTAVATSATVTTTGSNGITINGSLYVYGIAFSSGTGASNATFILVNSTGNYQSFTNCSFTLGTTSSSQNLAIGPSANQPEKVVFENCNLKFSAAGQYIGVGSATFEWNGGALLSGTSTPTTNGLIVPGSGRSAGDVIVSGVDLSQASSSLNLCSSAYSGSVVFRNCKLPASWAGSLITGTIVQGFRAEMHNCDSGDTNYRLMVQDYYGSILSETTIVRTGGANDGTTTISWKMVSGADAEYPHQTLNSPEIVRWNETTGSAITATVEIVTDNVTLTDGECWIEVQYLGTSGYPLGSFVSDVKADVLATAANQGTSTETWTTTGLTTPVKQKLSVSFTPQEKGYIHAVVKLAKASTTVYVDPELTIT